MDVLTSSLTSSFIFFGFLAFSPVVLATDSPVPEPFQRFDETSKYTINYDDLTSLLKTVVVDVGRSTREKVAPSQAATGTRMKASVKTSTANEANRYHTWVALQFVCFNSTGYQ